MLQLTVTCHCPGSPRYPALFSLAVEAGFYVEFGRELYARTGDSHGEQAGGMAISDDTEESISIVLEEDGPGVDVFVH